MLLSLSALGWLMACSANVPDWWNPSGKYHNEPFEKAVPQAQAPVQKAVPLQKAQEITEEDIAPVGDDSLEEVEFQPLEDNPLPQETPAEQPPAQNEFAAPAQAAGEQTALQSPMPAPSILLEESAQEDFSAEEDAQEEANSSNED